jgi:2',3'-cyclic-nucleotide 2'-phosphodiesterase (5'-nucleotidase family)
MVKSFFYIFTILFTGLFLSTGCSGGLKREILILHTNDLNGSIETEIINSQIRAGIPSTVSLMKKLKIEAEKKGIGTIILDTGDAIFGSTLANLSKGKAQIGMLNHMGLTSMTLGNKEFNFSPGILENCSKGADFPFLCANIYDQKNNSPFPFIKKMHTIYSGGMKIGIIGIVSETMKYNINAETSNFYKFLPPWESLSKLFDDIQTDKFDLFVILAHMNIDQIKETLSKTNASNKINVVISANNFYEEEQLIPEGFEKYNNTIITWGTVAHNRRGIGALNLIINKSGTISSAAWHFESVNPEIHHQDNGCLQIAQSFESSTTHWNETSLGYSLKDFNHSHTRETPFGSFLSKIICIKGEAQISMINASAIKKGLSKGTITKKAVFEMMPYTNNIKSMFLTGMQIISALEHSLNRKSKSILLVHGISYEYNISKKGEKKLVSCMFNNQNIDPNRLYRIATSSFLANGGNHFLMFKNGNSLKDHGTIKTALIEWITSQKKEIDISKNWVPNIKKISTD